tara:strand:+ start:13519 stop:13938 length:420 start_codon:yes stop_codon:yes gene_type:complete
MPEGQFPEAAWSITPIAEANTCPQNTLSVPPMQVSSHPSAVSGDSYDNALAETINGLCKAEVIHRKGPWKSMDAVEYGILIWVDRFNNRRLLGPIGHIPPAEAETNYYAALKETAIAALPQPNCLRGYRAGLLWDASAQ